MTFGYHTSTIHASRPNVDIQAWKFRDYSGESAEDGGTVFDPTVGLRQWSQNDVASFMKQTQGWAV
jgi:hypothetical protein